MKLLYLFFCCWLTAGICAQNSNLSGGLIYEGEPYIVMNPQNSQHLVVAWMGFQFGQKVVIRTTTSFDGGATWSPISNLPHIASTNGSADPSVPIDNLGNVYVCYIDYDNESFLNGAIVVAKSTDGGLTWGVPVEAINISQCPNQLCVDRPWMVVDNSGTSSDGTIYVTSMNAGQPSLVTPPYHPYLSVSTDQGASFSSPRFLDTLNFQAGSIIDKPMPTPAVGADGRFLAVYPSYELSQSVFAQAFLASSSDLGITLNHQLVAQSPQGFSENSTKKGPLLVASKVNAAHYAYVTLAEINGDLDVFITETLDAGMTWGTLQRVNDDPVGNGVLQDLVWADFNEQDDLVVCWRDRRNDGAGFSVDSDIYSAVKFADSLQFSENFAVTDITITHDPMLENSGNDFMSVVFSYDTIHAVWGDVRNNVINIFYNKMSVHNPVLNISTIASTEWHDIPIYPNPSSNFINVDDEFIEGRYQLYTSSGKLVRQGRIVNMRIEISELQAGSYRMILSVGSKVKSFCVVKKD
ncbi:MAG: T9SS type A sorting domain-containing protein [Crocinitomicaceae bacterium]|nr:T9SS type A sorting domain-containing protein [Crocinitomicaceae bacterium]